MQRGDEPVDPGSARDEVVRLVEKYERMRALRDVLGRGTPSPAHRDQLRALSHDFPGSLRELEQLGTTAIDARLVAARAAQTGLVPAWLLWTARYHTRMVRALRDKAGRAGSLPSGRLNVLVFQALANELDVPVDVLWETLFPSGPGRPSPLHRRP